MAILKSSRRRNPEPSRDAKVYETRLDAKKRVVLRTPTSVYYEVHEKTNGSILMIPKKLVNNESISARTLRMMDESVSNLKKGRVSDPINLNRLRAGVTKAAISAKPRRT